MTPKEKAKELYGKFSILVERENFFHDDVEHENSKKAAIICVDEIIKNCPFKDYGFKFNSVSSRLEAVSEYWEEVKQELLNL